METQAIVSHFKNFSISCKQIFTMGIYDMAIENVCIIIEIVHGMAIIMNIIE